MAGKRVLLTLNQKLYSELQKIADSDYMSVQELISDILRKDILAKTKKKNDEK
jgi:metal-responsive CopG/Arc/MetJ family transcriptional regulator|tara:strand:+ start:441 stop:599 length:159 start_codon:yes stop_codon:yes gene_type:complete